MSITLVLMDIPLSLRSPLQLHRLKTLCGFWLMVALVGLTAGCTKTLHPPEANHLQVLRGTPIFDKKNKPLQNRYQNHSLLYGKIPQPPEFTHFTAAGKIGFSDGKRGGNAAVSWDQQGEIYNIRLSGPIGSGSIQIVGDPAQASLQDVDGKLITAKQPEELVLNSLGWIIPVSGLRYWLQGLPAPGIPPTSVTIDNHQRIWAIEQQGWTITYQAYRQADVDTLHGYTNDTNDNTTHLQHYQHQYVPNKLVLKNGTIRLKFIFTQWVLTKRNVKH